MRVRKYNAHIAITKQVRKGIFRGTYNQFMKTINSHAHFANMKQLQKETFIIT